MKYSGKIIDSHLHMHGGYEDTCAFFAGMESLADAVNYTTKNVVMVPQWDREFVSQNQLGILYKALYPGKLYAYAGFDYYMPEGIAHKDLEQQARDYVAMGFDGIKMVELKPTVYRNLGGVRLSDSEYDRMFGYLEQSGTPLLFHVGDPETFWDDARAPAFAKENGWFYGTGNFPALEALYADVEGMLARHPRLNVVFAHFFFLSDDIRRAERVLEKYPNVRFDLTPGTEMYGNFSKMPEQWNVFFQKYADRILFGTDNGWGSTTPMSEKVEFAVNNVANVRRFLETADHFKGYEMQIRGLDLPQATLEKIYAKNFEAMAGSAPKKVDCKKALAYVQEMLAVYEGKDIPFYDRVVPQMKFVAGKLQELIAREA